MGTSKNAKKSEVTEVKFFHKVNFFDQFLPPNHFFSMFLSFFLGIGHDEKYLSSKNRVIIVRPIFLKHK